MKKRYSIFKEDGVRAIISWKSCITRDYIQKLCRETTIKLKEWVINNLSLEEKFKRQSWILNKTRWCMIPQGNIYNHIFPKLLKTFRLDFLVFKLDFEETKLGFSNCKFPSILGLTFQLLKRSRNPSKSKFSSKQWKFWKFFNFENDGFRSRLTIHHFMSHSLNIHI